MEDNIGGYLHVLGLGVSKVSYTGLKKTLIMKGKLLNYIKIKNLH